MNSLNKKIVLIAISALALTSSTGFILQTDAYAGLKYDFNLLFKENEKNKKQIGDQALTIQQLGEEIRMKDDSIATLNLRIESLVEESNTLKDKIRSLDQKVQQRSDQVTALTGKISKLESGNTTSLSKIESLENERNELLKQMEIMDRERSNKKQKLQQTESEVILHDNMLKNLEKQTRIQKQRLEMVTAPPPAKEPVYAAPSAPAPPAAPSIDDQKVDIIKARKQARMREIVMHTTIDYRSISLRNEKEGKDLDKVKNEGWRYTVIEFDLHNPDQDAIFDEEFILQVFDVDNQRVVPFNESNPGFPESETGSTGYRFTYEGQPMTIAYFNSQKKTAKNYEVRLFYAGKGYLLPIMSGNTRIVAEGLVAAR